MNKFRYIFITIILVASCSKGQPSGKEADPFKEMGSLIPNQVLENKAKIYTNFNKDYLTNLNKVVAGSVKDYSNNEYSLVEIGKLKWTNENLKSTFFANGDTIYFAENIEQWIKHYRLSEPAYCYPYFNKELADKYGFIYNFHVVDSENPIIYDLSIPTVQNYEYFTWYLADQLIIEKENDNVHELWQVPYVSVHKRLVSQEKGGSNSVGFNAMLGGNLLLDNRFIKLMEREEAINQDIINENFIGMDSYEELWVAYKSSVTLKKKKIKSTGDRAFDYYLDKKNNSNRNRIKVSTYSISTPKKKYYNKYDWDLLFKNYYTKNYPGAYIRLVKNK